MVSLIHLDKSGRHKCVLDTIGKCDFCILILVNDSGLSPGDVGYSNPVNKALVSSLLYAFIYRLALIVI